METGGSCSKNDGNPVLNIPKKASISSSSSRKKDSSRNGSQYLSNVLPDRFPQKKRSLHPVSSCPYKQKVGGVSLQTVYNVGQNSVSAFTQRVMSAKLLRVKQLQNQLTDTQNQLNELVNENRLLRTLQKRQAVALQRFEGSQNQLPQLIKSHNEEIRVLNSKIKQMKEKYSDMESRLKRKDAELSHLKENHKHLLQLSQDKQLVDREKLTKRVEHLESKEKELNEKIQLLNRRLELEGKNHRHQLIAEAAKLKETQSDLKSALGTINNLKAALEAKEKYVNCTMPKKYQQSMEHLLQNSHVSLPIPPRVSIRQPDKFSDTAMQNHDDSSSDSDVSYNKVFEEKNTEENEAFPNLSEKRYKNNVRWNDGDQDSKSNSSSNDAKETIKENVNQSDDSLDGLKLNRNTEGKKKKRLFTNVIGVGREITANYSFGNKLNTKLKDKTHNKSAETLGRLKPRSRSLSKDSQNEAVRATQRVNPLKKGGTGKHYLADRESSSDEQQKVIEADTDHVDDEIDTTSPLTGFHQEIEYELEQVIKSGSAGISLDDSEDIFVNCEPVNEKDAALIHSWQHPSKTVESTGLDRFSKLTWNQIKDELPPTKEEILNILDQAHPEINDDPIALDEEKKTNLLKMLNDIDNDGDSFENALTDGIVNGHMQSKRVNQTKKKHILQEIFKS